MSSKLCLLFFGCVLLAPATVSVWQCGTDSDCANLAGSVCVDGACACPVTQQVVAGGTRCADVAPYHTSACVEDFQCARLFTAFQCRREDEQTEGNCFCQPNHHFFLGRCWPSVGPGEACTRSEECMGAIRDPYALICNQTCQCADGYYQRQRGECRKIAAAVGERCVLDEDCQFTNGACDRIEFVCYDSTNSAEVIRSRAENVTHKVAPKMAANMAVRQHGVACSAVSPCDGPFECSSMGVCVCPVGYYGSEDGTTCYAELGSPSTAEQCVGFLAVVENGICTCPANFFFDEGMRDCTKVVRALTDTCLSDAQCQSFGAAARCGAAGAWGLRHCACDAELAVWDAARSMCRLFAGIGESCQVDSDCMAGELEIQCQLTEEGEGYCACPEGQFAVDGLCLTTGLELGDECQMTQECTETANTVCEGGRCSCDNGYQQVDDYCAPVIGGACALDTDCVINNTVCAGAEERTCQCADSFAEYSDECWENSLGYNASCTVDAQCAYALGLSGACRDGHCLCGDSHHYRDGACWPITGLFESCSRRSQCYLGELTDVVECRNGLCQCDFHHPYSEDLGTCVSSATNVAGSAVILISSIMYMLYNS